MIRQPVRRQLMRHQITLREAFTIIAAKPNTPEKKAELIRLFGSCLYGIDPKKCTCSELVKAIAAEMAFEIESV